MSWLLQCAEQSDGEDNTSDGEIGKHVPSSSQHTAGVATAAVSASHTLSARSADSGSKADSQSNTDAVVRTVAGTEAELSSPTSQSPYQHQHRASELKKKSMRRVRTTRCNKCINCLTADCGKCPSCRSVHVLHSGPNTDCTTKAKQLEVISY